MGTTLKVTVEMQFIVPDLAYVDPETGDEDWDQIADALTVKLDGVDSHYLVVTAARS